MSDKVYQYRWYDADPHTVTYGQFYEWVTCSEGKYNEINEYIRKAKTYETRILTVTHHNKLNINTPVGIRGNQNE
jgi:hypothetical protein